MGKNIVIFSDGTGQRAGISFDERRSNIYKLYRATRCGPDTTIKPDKQITFYDPGIGTTLPGAGTLRWLWAVVYNAVCMATGWGLTRNVVDCYAAIIRLWEPGDKIYLFGFSRGAYTVRLLGGLLSHCGVPRKIPGGDIGSVPRDEKGARKIAKYAVGRVYQHTASARLDGITDQGKRKRKRELLDQRNILAATFREDYGSADPEYKPAEPDKNGLPDRGQANVEPYFIGIFDTVASMFHWRVLLAILIAACAFAVLTAAVIAWITGWPFKEVIWYFLIAFDITVCLWVYFHIRIPGPLNKTTGLAPPMEPKSKPRFYTWWETLTFKTWMQFDDRELSARVEHAYHALAIDETRSLFQFVDWRGNGIEQRWFAGVHSDVGGGYPENDSRLSDISLRWMSKAADSHGLQLEKSLLNLHPDATGREHDELKARWWLWGWQSSAPRDIPGTHEIDESVCKRIAQPSVLRFSRNEAYRPLSLKSRRFWKD